MSEIEQIENRIKKLSPEELAKLRAWFAEFDAQAWDRQIEADSATGKLDHFIEESLAEHKAGKSRPL
jgi:predicted esterase